ncbi:MAG: hypothetical protein ACOC53_07055 [Candidatus Saliniplasma sp.]
MIASLLVLSMALEAALKMALMKMVLMKMVLMKMVLMKMVLMMVRTVKMTTEKMTSMSVQVPRPFPVHGKGKTLQARINTKAPGNSP